MENKIGVMQGRLLPKFQGRFQAFPIGNWQKEFSIAKKCELDSIEFILDFNDAFKNPLLNSNGIENIKNIVKKTGVHTKTICADYFMEAPLHSKNNLVVQKSTKVLELLIDSSIKLGVTDIVIPCVDQASLSTSKSVDKLIVQVSKFIEIIEQKDINLSLETDLDPQSFLNLLNKIDSKNVTVNYDIGNSAALGFNHIEELDAYGNKITDIHIKDRVLGGGSVKLGQGDANFVDFFDKLKKFDYDGPLIMQAYRDDEGLNIFKEQLDWIKRILNG